MHVVARLPDGKVWQTARGGLLCNSFGKMTWESGSTEQKLGFFQPVFRDVMTDAGLTVAGDPDNLFERQGDLGDLQVAAVITDMDIDYCQPKVGFGDTSLHGHIDLQVEWQVFSPLEQKVIAKLTTHGAYETHENVAGGVPEFMRQAFRDAAHKAAADAGFRAALATSPASQVDAAQKPEAQPPIVLVGASAAKARPVAESVADVTVVFSGSGHGSGFLVSADGYLLTARHVVGDSKFVKVRWSDGVEDVGEVVRTDTTRDVALIKTNAHGRAPLPLRRDLPQVGDTVFAIGAPESDKLQNTVTRGIVSADRTLLGRIYIQSDVNVAPGSSGGPLLDEKGQVVGLADLAVRPGGVAEGLNLFTPIGDALDYLGVQPG